MSLIKCPACQKDVSKDATTCPHCGQPINKTQSAIGVLAAIIIAFILFYFVVLPMIRS